MTTIHYVLIVMIAVGWLVIIGRFIPWRDLAVKWVGNKPTKARVYVESADEEIICQAERVYIGQMVDAPIVTPDVRAEGELFKYEYAGQNKYVLVPKGYVTRWVMGKRRVRVIDGEFVAAPLEISGSNVPLSVDDVSEFIRGQVFYKHSQALVGPGMKLGAIWLYLVGALAIGGGVVYFLFGQGGAAA